MNYTPDDQKQIQQAIITATNSLQDLPEATKPVLLHSIRVGSRLYRDNYPVAIVMAGYLHDVIEDTSTTKDDLSKLFGLTVAELVVANSKNDEITDRNDRHEELLRRCLANSQEAAIVKAADILDNLAYYQGLGDQKNIDTCLNNIRLFKQYFNPQYHDPIFTELFAGTKYKN